MKRRRAKKNRDLTDEQWIDKWNSTVKFLVENYPHLFKITDDD